MDVHMTVCMCIHWCMCVCVHVCVCQYICGFALMCVICVSVCGLMYECAYRWKGLFVGMTPSQYVYVVVRMYDVHPCVCGCQAMQAST